jgi:nitrite reductase (NADH) large subunit
MDSLIGTYEDEWKRAVQDPDLRKQFRQFVNTVSVARGFDWVRFDSLRFGHHQANGWTGHMQYK